MLSAKMSTNLDETHTSEMTGLGGKYVLSQTDPSLLRQMVSGGLRAHSLLRNRTAISRINYISNLSTPHPQSDVDAGDQADSHRQDLAPNEVNVTRIVPNIRLEKCEEDLLTEQFPVVVTPLLNEEQLWGCFYTFPELYADVYSPAVRVRHVKDVPELVGGVLTRDMVTACLTYLKRTPILGDIVYIKLDLSYMYLVNIEVLQHYKYLVYLDLSFNYLTELTVLSHLLYLQHLKVPFNRLGTVLDYETPQWFLTEVNYRYNSVKKIRDLTMFWSIAVLDLSHNNIKVISGLENLHYLRRLDLSFNHIQRLENLNNLRLLWLDVSYNNISSFEITDTTGLWTLYHLEYLNLNENNLTSMKIFSGCTRIRELHARNNRLGVLLELAVYMRQMRRLTTLDLRANPICAAPGYKNVVVNTFPLLLKLDAQDLDPVVQRSIKMSITPDIHAFATRRLLRLLYIEQLSRARVSPFVPPADTTEVPMVIFVGYEAVGKGTLVRRLAEKCKSNVSVARQHTTAHSHESGPSAGRYIEVARDKFDDMLLAGEFLTYTEKDGDSYGLSRQEAYVKDGKVKIASMDLISALMMEKRGRHPYLILTTCLDVPELIKRQKQRRETRNKLLDKLREFPLEKSTLQVLISGRILVTGILNEIIMCLPEDKQESEFLVESQCSLLLDSATRKAVQENAQELNMLNLLSTDNSSLDEIGKGYNTLQNEASLCSLFKESQNTDEFASDITNGHSSLQKSGDNRSTARDSRNGRLSTKPDKLSDASHPKSVDFSRYVSSTWKGGGVNSIKSAKSVMFTPQDAAPEAEAKRLSVSREMTMDGMLVESQQHAQQSPQPSGIPKSVSRKFPVLSPHTSHNFLDDGDPWLTFLVETGLLQTSDTDEPLRRSAEMPRRETKSEVLDDIMTQLSFYGPIQGPTLTTNIRDDYEEIYRKQPGLFWDTIVMDGPDPDAPFQKAKRIIQDIVESQKHLKPMFDIDFHSMPELYPNIQKKLKVIANQIAPKRFFF